MSESDKMLVCCSVGHPFVFAMGGEDYHSQHHFGDIRDIRDYAVLLSCRRGPTITFRLMQQCLFTHVLPGPG